LQSDSSNGEREFSSLLINNIMNAQLFSGVIVIGLILLSGRATSFCGKRLN
jgi:hypothetical protein